MSPLIDTSLLLASELLEGKRFPQAMTLSGTVDLVRVR